MSRIRLNVKSVIFDMDGVITNTMPDHYRSWKAVLKDAGINVTYEDIYKREGQPGTDSVREIFREYKKGLGGNKAVEILRRKEDFFKKIVRMRFITGARTFLKHLHRQNVSLALVTGTSRDELGRILPIPLYRLFSAVVTGNDVRHGKPHPEPYLKSLDILQVDPSEAVAIENAPFGIRSAKRAGLACLALETSLPREYLYEADAVFKSVKELERSVKFSFNGR